jgi:hypothetical protein
MPSPLNHCTASTIEHLCIIAIPAKGITQQIQTLKVNIMLTFDSHGKEINRRHLLAQQTATDAVEHARVAGNLLIEVKKDMKHGKFQHWVSNQLGVSMRQAQRYMAVAQGKPVAMRQLAEKSDTMVSHLKKLFDKPMFIPELGHKYETVVWTSGTEALWVRIDPFKPLQEHNYLIRCFTHKEDGFDKLGFMDQTIKPVPAALVNATLKSFGLEEPQSANWNISPSEGFNKPRRSWDEKGNTILKCDWEEVV